MKPSPQAKKRNPEIIRPSIEAMLEEIRATLPAVEAMANTDRYLKIKEVVHLTGYSKSGIYDLMRRGKFPKRIKLSARRSVWRDSEIQAWIRGDFEPMDTAPVLSIFGGGIQS